MNTTTNNITSAANDANMPSNNTAPSLAPSSYNNDAIYNESNTIYTGGRSSGYNEGSTFTFILGIAFVFLFMI